MPLPSEGPGVDWTHPILATRLLCGGLVAAHLLGGAWLWLTTDADLLAMLFLDRPRELRIAVGGQHQVLIERGAQWRWLSSVFLHTGAVHLAVNVTGLWALGRLLEPWIGGARWLGVFVGGGLCGSIASSMVGVTQSDGASGGGFARMGALWVLAWRVRTQLHPEDRRLFGPVLSGFLLLNLALGLAIPFVDAAAHAGGLIFGVLAGWLLAPPSRA